MLDPTAARWIELRFYYICSDLLDLRKDMMDIMNVFQLVSLFGPFEELRLEQLAHEIVASLRFRPSKEEFVVLAKMNNMPIQQIIVRSGLCRRSIYKILQDEAKDPRAFYPRFGAVQIEYIEQFIQAFEKFKQVGV